MTTARGGGRRVAGAMLLAGVAVSAISCSSGSAPQAPAPQLVADAALANLLLTPNEIQSAMHGTPFMPQPVDSTMDDNRNLLPNLNCLGVWHPGETAIYGRQDSDGGWTSVRRQLLRTPGKEQWQSSVVQSVTAYPTIQKARDFLADSGARWAKCTNHTVNITLNDQRMPRWRSGELVQTPDQLTMPITRADGVDTASCQHVVSVVTNVVIDVEACAPRAADVTGAAQIATRIASHIPG
ncbi:sensor domain-containing protein [Mycolicibacterium chubuense]|uniref:sensor domain-containing protein n=1 Tax=Mycolicibacterium chubuense TaxID=1800 RepID=UPI001EEFDCB3|nr:sensor domain-containing protein [Mycolicibacterium chubuense]